MKYRIHLTILLLFIITGISQAQVPANVKSYAVIGVFSLEQNADRYADFYKTKSLTTNVRKNLYNDMYYVYTEESDDVEEVRSKVLSLREQFAALQNAWLYNGNFNCLHIPSDQLKQSMSVLDSNEATDASSGNVDGLEVLVYEVEEAELEREERQAQEVEDADDIYEGEGDEDGGDEPVSPQMAREEGTYWVYFNTYNVTDLKEVGGEVKVVDAERSKDLGNQPAHTLVVLGSPKNGTNRVTFESDIFGFQPEVRTIDLDEPKKGDDSQHITTLGDSIIVDFPLRRFNKGDVMTLWKVYFYIDAAIMKEESVPQLNQLLNMMRENENMRIMIHGHTNGNSHGVVKHLDPEDKKFFSITSSHQEDKASAKKLSEYRAYTIQQWLVDQGISEDRMETQGWGGKKMLYDKHSNSAEKNVRVEIEILAE